MGNDWLEHLEAASGASSTSSESPFSPTSPIRHSLLSSSSSSSQNGLASSSSSYSPTSPPPRFVCSRCRCDLTCLKDVIWEGVMGQRSETAFLSRRCVNVALSFPVRHGVQLSSGSYDLVDVECRRCRETLGWKYLRRASASAEKFKVGCTMLAAVRLERVVGFDGEQQQQQ